MVGAGNLILCFLYQIQDFFCTFPENQSFFRQRDLAGTLCAADQQLFSKLLFHIFNLRGQCGLGEMKRLGGPYDALFSCDGKKILQYPYFHIYAPSYCSDLFTTLFLSLKEALPEDTSMPFGNIKETRKDTSMPFGNNKETLNKS